MKRAARSLRAHLLRMLLPPLAALLAAGAVAAYFPSIEPATEAYDQQLVDIGIALGSLVEVTESGYRFELPVPLEQILRRDKADALYYRVLSPGSADIAGEPALPEPPRALAERHGLVRYDAEFKGQPVRAVTVQAPCGRLACTVIVAETTGKRSRLMQEVLVSSMLPEALIALATLVIVWFGVKRGLSPLARLSSEIKTRGPGDLRPVDPAAAPEETRPLVAALNVLLERVGDASRQQQRFLANAAHQLRTPLAGLQAHTEIALAQSAPGAQRAELEQLHEATVRTARLANQLLALSRVEAGVPRAPLDLKRLVEDAADEWVHRALERDIDLGFELARAPMRGAGFLLYEALANLLHNALAYVPRGGRVTVRTGLREDGAGNACPFLEVEDDGPGIPQAERERVLERFYRVPGTAGTGSGLGLAIVREIAHGHGGEVAIESGAGGRGCRVGITFPPEGKDHG